MNETASAVADAPAAMPERLRITEIFLSLQGESRSVGWPTVFIRLTGCPLRCGYCDTTYAFQGGEWLSLDDILARTAAFGVRHVTVTGGEPLAQKACLPLLTRLCDAGYEVSLETSGALDVARVDPRVVKVMDLKTPGSGEVERNRWCNLEHLNPRDQIKFVLCDRADYEWAREQLVKYELPEICEVLFSPVQGRLAPRELADWIVADRLPVRFQIQLHKYLWGDTPGT
ncbi:MAG: 7-carboxy-7-deazaguanine synthase QueE [Gammaproteobacteria bacterium]|jgi:7-carboxy-7-deazaguanine synthase|nr:7-carboxy-7-deazaguanine synthase QueE [Gammaproteobacteria bacterium]